MDRNIIFVGIGGLVGSIVRYLVGTAFAAQFAAVFPFATLVVNIAGCFLIGVLFGLIDRGSILSPEWRSLLTTGFCGGLTTFSTFSYESTRLMQDGEFLYLALNVGVSVVVGLAATYLGIFVIRSL
jgi:CrcB protein